MIRRKSHRRPDSIEAYAFCYCNAAACHCLAYSFNECLPGCSSVYHAHDTQVQMQHMQTENRRQSNSENLHRGAQRAQNMQA